MIQIPYTQSEKAACAWVSVNEEKGNKGVAGESSKTMENQIREQA